MKIICATSTSPAKGFRRAGKRDMPIRCGRWNGGRGQIRVDPMVGVAVHDPDAMARDR
jgi:hypothetical protein